MTIQVLCLGLLRALLWAGLMVGTLDRPATFHLISPRFGVAETEMPTKPPFRPAKTRIDPPPFAAGSLWDVLSSGSRSRLTRAAAEIARQIPVQPNTNINGGRFFYQSGGPFGHIEAERNSPPLLFHEFTHGLEHLPSEYMSEGMFQGNLGTALWPLLDTEHQAMAERLYGNPNYWGPGEYYPMIGQMYNWSPAAMPTEIRPYYDPWFRMSPDPRDLSFGTMNRRAYNGYPNRWTGGP